jgi:hypothetical protein
VWEGWKISEPTEVKMPRIYDVNSFFLGNPTHIRTSFKDEIRNKAVVKTVYTGIIEIGHGAEDTSTGIEFQYPLLGFFDNNGTLTPGIIPIDHERQFLGAAATAALSGIFIKDTLGICGVNDINADLHRVDLAPTNFQVLAVVLTGRAHATEAEVYQMAYHVTVLNGLSDKEDNRFGAPILSNSPDWNGTYGAIGTTPVKSGRPTEKFP